MEKGSSADDTLITRSVTIFSDRSRGDDDKRSCMLFGSAGDWTGASRSAVMVITKAAAATPKAVRATEFLASGTSHTRGRRPISAPTAVPAVLKMMSLSDGSLPGIHICAISTVVESSRPHQTALTGDRDFHPSANPSGTNRQRFRIASASQRPPTASSKENGKGGPFPAGVSVITRITSRTAATAISRGVGGRLNNIHGRSAARTVILGVH